jgi:hypothetical protein
MAVPDPTFPVVENVAACICRSAVQDDCGMLCVQLSCPCRAAAEAVLDRYVSSNTAVAFGNGELVSAAGKQASIHRDVHVSCHIKLVHEAAIR